jgi:hypothetical protein
MSTENPQIPPAATSPDADAPPPPRKKSGLRVVKWVVLLLLLVIVVGGVVLYLNLNRIVKQQVEKQSTAQLNVPTQLSSANVSLFGGSVSLKNFDVGSPQGFSAPAMMSLGGIDVGVKLGELRQDPIRVNQIAINQPKMVIEMKGTDFNIKKFVDQLPAGEPKPADDNKPPMKLIINDLKVNGAQVVFRPDLQALSALPGIGDSVAKGLKQEYVLSIPDLNMQNVGSGEGNQNGAAIKDIVTMLVQQLAAKATESEQLPPELRNVLSLNVDQLTEMAKQKLTGEVNKRLEQAKQELQKKLPGEAGKAIGDVLNNPDLKSDPGKAVQQGLGNILGGGGAGKDKKNPATAPATPAK